MRAFTDTEVAKDQLIASLEAHREADRIIQGRYWSDGRGGCAIGCAIHDFRPGSEGEHALAPELFGVPEIVARLGDAIHEGLPKEAAKDWPLRWFGAIQEGADLARVGPAVLYRIVERRRDALDDLDISDRLREEVRDAMKKVLEVLAGWRDTGEVDADAAEYAEYAARAAARAAWDDWAANVLIEEINGASVGGV